MTQPEQRILDLHWMIGQYQQIGDVEKAAWDNHAERILQLQALPEEVENWYFASDPMSSRFFFDLDTARETQDFGGIMALQKEIVDEDLIMARGGLILFASVLFHDAFDSDEVDSNKWFANIEEKYYKPVAEQGHVSGIGEMTATGLLELCLLYVKHGEISFSSEDLSRLFMSAEMLRISCEGLLRAHRTGTIKCIESTDEKEVLLELEEIKKDAKMPFYGLVGVSAEGLEKFIRDQNILSDSTLRFIETFANPIYPDGGEIEEVSDDVRMLALKAQSLYASSWLSDDFEGIKVDRLARGKDEFMALVKTLQKMFSDIRSPIIKRIKTPNIKGTLHEVLWLLDAYVLRMAYPEQFGHVRAFPTYTRQDAPKIGYPHQKRGYDFTVTNGPAVDYIQLKSSSRRNGATKHVESSYDGRVRDSLTDDQKSIKHISADEYDPEIRVLCEKNFMELDPRRLAAKLNAYARWSEMDFAPDMVDGVVKYVMDTVRTEFDSIARRKTDRSKFLRKIMAERIIKPMVDPNLRLTPNRAQRRLRARMDRRKS